MLDSAQLPTCLQFSLFLVICFSQYFHQSNSSGFPKPEDYTSTSQIKQKDLRLYFIADSIILLEAEGKYLPSLCLLGINLSAWTTPGTQRDNHTSRHARPGGRGTHPELPLGQHFSHCIQKKIQPQDVILCTDPKVSCGQINLGNAENDILLEIHKHVSL